MADQQDPRSRRLIDRSIEIDAEPAVVWEAITDAEELCRWFPLDAAIEPGAGGRVRMSWGPDFVEESRIEVWDDGKRLRCVRPGLSEGTEVAVDYEVRGRGGTTVLRVVQSGFDVGDEWDDLIEALDSGWRYFLWNLKVYLEEHRGARRRMVWDRRRVDRLRSEVWAALFDASGPMPVSGAPRASARLHLWSGHAGVVEHVTDGIHLAARFDELGGALLFVELEPGAEYHLGVWLSLYDADPELGESLERGLRRSLERFVTAEGNPVAVE